MQRRAILKDGTEQLAGNDRVHARPRLDVIAEILPLFQRDQRAGLRRGHLRAGLDQLFDQMFLLIAGKRGQPRQHAGLAQLLQQHADLRLKDDHHDDDAPAEHHIGDVVDRRQPDQHRQSLDDEDEQDALEDLHRSGIVADDAQAEKDDGPHQPDVQKRPHHIQDIVKRKTEHRHSFLQRQPDLISSGPRCTRRRCDRRRGFFPGYPKARCPCRSRDMLRSWAGHYRNPRS